METNKYEPGTRVKYWGHAANNKYYGMEFTVEYAHECSCKHQTYSIINDEGKQVSKALHENLTPVE